MLGAYTSKRMFIFDPRVLWNFTVGVKFKDKQLYNHTIPMLDGLHSNNKLLAISSNNSSPRKSVIYMEHFGISKYFDNQNIIINQHHKFDHINTILNNNAILPEQSAYIDTDPQICKELKTIFPELSVIHIYDKYSVYGRKNENGDERGNENESIK